MIFKKNQPYLVFSEVQFEKSREEMERPFVHSFGENPIAKLSSGNNFAIQWYLWVSEILLRKVGFSLSDIFNFPMDQRF